MNAWIECIVDAPEKENVEEVLTALSSAIAKLEGIDWTITDIEKRSGLFEATFVGALILNVATPVFTGIAANALWSWILSKRASIKTANEQKANDSVKITMNSINIIISVKTKKELTE